MSEYHIEKVRRDVAVTLYDGRHLRGDIFVQSLGRHHNGPEEPIELFNDRDPFFPLVAPDGTVAIIAKAQVLRVEHEAMADNPLEQPELGAPVRVVTADGASVTGFVFPATRAARARLLDFLNEYDQSFLPVFTANGVCLVNRSGILLVEPQG